MDITFIDILKLCLMIFGIIFGGYSSLTLADLFSGYLKKKIKK